MSHRDEETAIEAANRQQAAMIRELQEQMAALARRIGPEPVPPPEPGKFYAFPRAVYKAHDKAKPAQIDHPGADSTVARNQAHLDQLLSEGWSLEYVPPAPAPAADSSVLEDQALPKRFGKR